MRKIKRPIVRAPRIQEDLEERWIPRLQLQAVAVEPTRRSPCARQQAHWFAFELQSRPYRLH
jgi:hypothetical protein